MAQFSAKAIKGTSVKAGGLPNVKGGALVAPPAPQKRVAKAASTTTPAKAKSAPATPPAPKKRTAKSAKATQPTTSTPPTQKKRTAKSPTPKKTAAAKSAPQQAPVTKTLREKILWGVAIVVGLLVLAALMFALVGILKNRQSVIPQVDGGVASESHLASGSTSLASTASNTQGGRGQGSLENSSTSPNGSAFSASINGSDGRIVQVAGDLVNIFTNSVDGRAQNQQAKWPEGFKPDHVETITPPANDDCFVAVVIPRNKFHRFNFPAGNYEITPECYNVPLSQIKLEINGHAVDVHDAWHEGRTKSIGIFNGGEEALPIRFHFKWKAK